MRRGVVRCAAAIAVTIAFAVPAVRPTGPARAETAVAVDPSGFITQVANGALQNISGATLSLQERQERFRALLSEYFDMPRIARFTLGRYWNETTPDQRSEFTTLLQDYLVTTYAGRFVDYGGSLFRPVGVRPDDPGVVVLTEMLRVGGGAPVRVGWRLASDAPPYHIVDVYIENISMALTQRSEFASVIQRNGGRVDDLLAALHSKLGRQTPG